MVGFLFHTEKYSTQIESGIPTKKIIAKKKNVRKEGRRFNKITYLFLFLFISIFKKKTLLLRTEKLQWWTRSPSKSDSQSSDRNKLDSTQNSSKQDNHKIPNKFENHPQREAKDLILSKVNLLPPSCHRTTYHSPIKQSTKNPNITQAKRNCLDVGSETDYHQLWT